MLPPSWGWLWLRGGVAGKPCSKKSEHSCRRWKCNQPGLDTHAALFALRSESVGSPAGERALVGRRGRNAPESLPSPEPPSGASASQREVMLRKCSGFFLSTYLSSAMVCAPCFPNWDGKHETPPLLWDAATRASRGGGECPVCRSHGGPHGRDAACPFPERLRRMPCTT